MSTEKKRKLFGTDGIRAVAGQAPLDPTTIYACGLALGHSLRKEGKETPRVILGRDTRESGPWIAATLAAGLIEAGALDWDRFQIDPDLTDGYSVEIDFHP